MGRLFLEHLGGRRIFMCDQCQTYLTNRHEILSTHFRGKLFWYEKISSLGATGAAYLFRKVVNVRYAKVEERNMMTGRHLVRDVFCKNCDIKIGWMYEYAVDADQVYKEGMLVGKIYLDNTRLCDSRAQIVA